MTPPSSRKTESPRPRDRNTAKPVSGDLLDNLARFSTHFGRFTWDAMGVLMIAFALLTLLALLGLSRGARLSHLAAFLRVWFGWGAYLLVVVTGIGGWLVMRYSRKAQTLSWRRVVTLELAALLTLSVLSIIGSNSLYQAEEGWYGGRIGWGLATLATRLLGVFWGSMLVILLWVIALMSGFGLWRRLEAWIMRQAGETISPDLAASSGMSGQRAVATSTALERKPSKRQGVSLPPQFRKAFKAPEQRNEQIVAPPRGERLPPLNLLMAEQSVRPDERNINQTAGLIEKTLADFGIPARVVGYRIGPTVTQFAVEPGFIEKGGLENGDPNRQKVRVAQIAGLSRDLALALSAERLRIEAPVPGKSYVGIEVPNARAVIVRLRSILETEAFYRISSPLAIALGRDVSGQPVVADMARMPHLLIAGTTGSGKSVCIAAIATCLAMNNTPEDLRMVMIDSKMVELLRFNGLPHLYGKVETDLQRIMGVLRWIVVEMQHRYRLLEAARARDIDTYNHRLHKRRDGVTLPRIVLMIDELADLMMSAPDQTEHSLIRLAQLARATGIHLVMATQRPSTDVVTGLIKANFPARISFAVTSHVDSRVILDMQGADTLLGRGDMLFLNPEIGVPLRAQGVMLADQEIERVIAFWQKMYPSQDIRPPWESLLSQPEEDSDDVLIEQAITILKQEGRASASLLQRRLRIGYPRAARLLDQLEEMGVVGPSVSGGREREVLLEPDDENEESS